jgi:hypothetical protein
MTSVSIFGRRFVCAAAGIAIAAAPAVALFASVDHVAPRLTADCQDVQQPGSFSMDCTPTVEANTTDQLTEQEVAEPGFNASPGTQHSSGSSGGHR